MEVFSQVMSLLSSGVGAYGAYLIVMGAVQFSSSLKDKSGPGIQSGLLEIVGGVIIVSVAIYFSSITIS
ncbi:hypothetical protein BH739_04640 [Enterococcus casseliflavus]|nr:hypothetical protein BH739_04640 [Enterococcus casseliflavus]